MSFGGAGKTVKTPPVPPPEAIPEVGEEPQDIARKKRYKGSRSETFLTGNLAPESSGKKTLLG